MPTMGPSTFETALDSAKKSEAQLVVQEFEHEQPSSRKGFNFWMILVAISISMFMSALEFTAVSSALPTIVHDLDGEDFVWVGSAYALASTALLPASGAMAEIFGRRTTMLLSLALFALGSALSGAARNMNWLIAARTIQGAGGGGVLSLGSIILSDLVSLQERGLYNAMLGLTWAFAGGMGPLIGGSLAQTGQWRWLFYLNLPISGLAAILVFCFLKLRTPPGRFWDKVSRMDWMGNFIIIASSAACVLGLTWGGVRFAWTSAEVLVPLILGLVGMAGFLVYEATLAKNPVVPFTLLSNRTSLSGFIQTFLNPIIHVAIIYYLPVYYQACRGSSPTRSGVETFSISLTLGPALMITGASVQITKSYRVQLWAGWILLLLAMGTMSTLHADSSLSRSLGFTVFEGIGVGMIYSATYFPVLAPLPVSENAHALAFFSFCRAFASVWGVTIGAAVMQTQLNKRLPAEFIAKFPKGIAIAYSSIPVISSLDDSLRSEIREAFAQSINVVWKVLIGIAGLGFVSSLVMKALPLHTQMDERWGLEQDGRPNTVRPIDQTPVPRTTNE